MVSTPSWVGQGQAKVSGRGSAGRRLVDAVEVERVKVHVSHEVSHRDVTRRSGAASVRAITIHYRELKDCPAQLPVQPHIEVSRSCKRD